jgi:hypothetical protein
MENRQQREKSATAIILEEEKKETVKCPADLRNNVKGKRQE